MVSEVQDVTTRTLRYCSSDLQSFTEMTDPISIIGLLATVTQILSALHTYGKSVSHAKQDIKDLTTELLVLQGIIQQVNKRDLTQSSIVSTDPERDPHHVLISVERSLDDLAQKLKLPNSGFKRIAAQMKWPLSKGDFAEQLVRFERLKSLLVLVFLSESSENILSAVQSLKVDLDRDLKDVQNMLLRHKDSEMIRWLAPLSPAERHLRFSDSREPDTRKWFLDGAFLDWLSAPDQSMMCLTGKCMSSLPNPISESNN